MQWLVSNGALGEPTTEYITIQHARYLGVAPWDMAGVPGSAGDDCWFIWTNEAIRAENDARKQAERTAKNAQKHRPK